MCILLFIAFWLLRIEVSKEKNCIAQTMLCHHIHLASSNLTAKRVISRSPLRRPHLVPFMSACIVGLRVMYGYRGALQMMRFMARLHQASASTLQKLCYDTSNTVVIESNEVAWNWVATQFCSDFIIFNEDSITSVIIELSQHWRWCLV